MTFVHEKPNLFQRHRNDATFHRSNFTARPLTACPSRISLSDELQLETNIDEYEASYGLGLDKRILPHASRNFVDPGYTNNEHPGIAHSSTKADRFPSDTNESFPPMFYGKSSLYVHRTIESIASRKCLELLHYFKTAIGWPWVSGFSPHKSALRTNVSSLTLLIQGLHRRHFDLPQPARFYSTPCWPRRAYIKADGQLTEVSGNTWLQKQIAFMSAASGFYCQCYRTSVQLLMAPFLHAQHFCACTRRSAVSKPIPSY